MSALDKLRDRQSARRLEEQAAERAAVKRREVLARMQSERYPQVVNKAAPPGPASDTSIEKTQTHAKPAAENQARGPEKIPKVEVSHGKHVEGLVAHKALQQPVVPTAQTLHQDETQSRSPARGLKPHREELPHRKPAAGAFAARTQNNQRPKRKAEPPETGIVPRLRATSRAESRAREERRESARPDSAKPEAARAAHNRAGAVPDGDTDTETRRPKADLKTETEAARARSSAKPREAAVRPQSVNSKPTDPEARPKRNANPQLQIPATPRHERHKEPGTEAPPSVEPKHTRPTAKHVEAKPATASPRHGKSFDIQSRKLVPGKAKGHRLSVRRFMTRRAEPDPKPRRYLRAGLTSAAPGRFPVRTSRALSRGLAAALSARPASTTGPANDPIFNSIATRIGLFPAPAAPPPALNTQGPFIFKGDSTAVALRGVSVTGFDAITSIQNAPSQLQLDDVSLAVLQKLWGINLVRIPFQALTILSGNGTLAAADMLTALDAILASLAQAGMYALLSIEPPPPAGGANSVPPAPDPNTTSALQNLATRYAANPGVLYELFATPAPLGADWPQTAQVLIGTIRRQATAAMIFVNTGNGGVESSQFPLLFPTGEPVFNLVYTICVGTGNQLRPAESLLSSLANDFPVCASFWVDDDSRLTPRISDLLGRYGIHWAASNWNAEPPLVADAGKHDFSPTAWGLTAQRAVHYPVKQLFPAFRYATPANEKPQ